MAQPRQHPGSVGWFCKLTSDMTDPVRGVRRTENADLRTRNTFGVRAHAPLLLEVEAAQSLP